MNNIKKAILTVAIFSIIGCSSNYTSKAVQDLQMQHNTKIYENKSFNVLLQYKKDWKPNHNYIEKYEGNDGFFQISAYGGEGLEIDEVVQNEVKHALKPYGSHPEITKLSIQGQEARLIIPSKDQVHEFHNQAELIVKYPKAIKINQDTYYYFILWADKYNIHELYKTLRFIT